MSEEASVEKIDESLPSDWVNGLPDKLKDAPFLRPTKDGTIRTVDEVFSALENAAKLQGNLAESHIKIPAPDAADTDKSAARERILSLWPDLREVTEGEDTLPPAEIAGYKLPEGGDVLDATMVEDIAKFALEHKWGQKQFSDYAAKMIETQAGSVEQASQWQKDQDTKLVEKFGEAKAERIARVASAMEQSGATPEYVAAIKEGKVDADLISVVDTLVGKMIAMGEEGSQFVQQINTDARAMTPAEHKDRANELWLALQDIPETSHKYAETNRKRMEHIGLSMAQ